MMVARRAHRGRRTQTSNGGNRDGGTSGGAAQLKGFDCKSAWGPDADRHAKLLIVREAEGSLLEAYLQIGTRFGRFATGVSEITITPEACFGDP